DARWPHASTSYAVGGGGGGDRFSALPEGIIDHILSFLPAEDAVRSSVLSGLWRGDWAHAPALNLSDERHQGRFLAFARAVLSRYGAPDIPALNVAIGCESNLGPGTAAWLRDAMERAVGSISVSVTAPVPMDRLTLPRRLRAKSISLTLSSMYENADLVLPDEPCETVAFGSLVELNLSRARLQGGGGVSLGEFLSSCCPCLRLLRLSKVSDGRHSKLQVVAANLQVLVVRYCCFYSLSQWDTDNVVQISAPRLHNISWLGGLPGHLSFLTDCRCVQRLALGFKWYQLKDRGFQQANAMQLLEMCPGSDDRPTLSVLEELVLSHLFSFSFRISVAHHFRHVDLEQISRLPNIRALSLRIAGAGRVVNCNITPSIFFFLRQCLNLTRLHIDLSMLHQGSRSNHDYLVLPLQEIRTSGFMGSDREMELADLLFGVRAAWPALERISVSFPPIERLPDGSLLCGADGTTACIRW
uniref:F-box domain-containing protein n=1 Tax=Setaria italica TaxID=4555 RepID=K4A280_SETIT